MYISVKFVSNYNIYINKSAFKGISKLYNYPSCTEVTLNSLGKIIPNQIETELELELELEKNLFDKKYINVSTGYNKHTENDTHCRETLTLVQDVPLSREPPGKYK